MKNIYLSKLFLFLTVSLILSSCATQSVNTIVGVDYDETKNATDYFVLPFGSALVPGKWEKTNYNSISHQQFFRNQDSIIIALAFGSYNKYEFNSDGKYKGFDFVEAYYEWDSKYFMESFGLNRQVLESDSSNHFMTYKIYGELEDEEYKTYFLIGEKNGNISNFSISATDKWSESEKLKFLKGLYLSEKSE